MNFKTIFFRVSVFTLLFLTGLSLFAQPSSDFTTSDEGWGTVGMCPAESSPGISWSPVGGNPGGCIYAQDNSIGVWYFYPSNLSWKGDLSDYYGCELHFDLMTNNDGVPVGSQYDVLIIKNDNTTISYNTSPNPGEVWSSYVVPLSEGSWIRDGLLDATHCPDLSGPLATATDMINYLGDVKKIRIRAEFGGLNTETNYMDNVAIVCPDLLPVEIIKFTAEDKGNSVSRVTWTTLTETNCLGFNVEKSITGTSFYSIGFVEGNGTSTQLHEYELYDDNFITTSYYRLKQTDLNGESHYSDILSLQSAIQIESNTQIFPNPATDYLIVVVKDADPLLAYEISDISGKTISREVVEENLGVYEKKLDISHFPAGVYYISLIKRSGTESLKFEIIK